MPIGVPLNPGRIEWTGENPGIMLKKSADGPWSALALFFRVVYSRHGRGSALALFEKPGEALSLPHAHNVVISDNEPMARYLMSDFVARFGAFGGSAAFKAMTYLPLTSGACTGDPMGQRYVEAVNSDAISVELAWEALGRPTALELPPPMTGTKQHTMFSVLVEAKKAAIFINGRRLAGEPVPREQAGLKTTSAFLYFSESWIGSP